MHSKVTSSILLVFSPSYLLVTATAAFTIQTTTTRERSAVTNTQLQLLQTSSLSSPSELSRRTQLCSTPNNDNTSGLSSSSNSLAKRFDNLLEEGDLEGAVQLLKSQPDQDIVSLDQKARWTLIFASIEEQTASAEETTEVNVRKIAEFPLTSQPRNSMTQMYQTLKDQNQLQVFGAINSRLPPAAGSHAVRPSLLEDITSLPMQSLTPKPSDNLLLAGVTVAILEGILSVALGINLNFLVLATLLSAGFDRLVLNGAIAESIYKIFNPSVQAKIQRHEAGHFLCAYLLGCPVEGCVLNAWAALADSRFGMSRQVTAGTSFFDPILSDQINSAGRQVTRSSIDRYSMIVMAGIAAEAIHYGQADGGAGDEMALIAFLSQLNGGSAADPAPWNNITIRNQARWGALQAVLMLREYKPCYEALVEALDQGGKLGDCIYAIEKAARDNGLGPLREPLGYIVEKPGNEEIWTRERPDNFFEDAGMIAQSTAASGVPSYGSSSPSMDPAESMVKLSAYRQEIEKKLKAIDEKLDMITKES